MHSLAILVGILVIAAATHVNVAALGGATALGGTTAFGGYLAPSAPLQVAVALGLVVGSIAIGLAWRDRRWAVALVLGVALVAGETVAMVGTAERVVTARDSAGAPLRDANAALTDARARVALAERAKTDADAAAIAKAAERSCARNCRVLLEAATQAAARDLDDARLNLANLPAVRSVSPLAERLGIEAWLLDLITAALASVAANGLGAALIAFGAHRTPAGRPAAAMPPPERSLHTDGISLNPVNQSVVSQSPVSQNLVSQNLVSQNLVNQNLVNHDPTRPAMAPLQLIAPPVDAGPVPRGDPRQHVARYLREAIEPDADGAVSLRSLHARYRDWCAAGDLEPLSPTALGQTLRDTFDRLGLDYRAAAGDLEVVGARLRTAA